MVARSGPRISCLYFQYKPRVIPVVGNLFTTAGCKRAQSLVAGHTYNSGRPQVAHPWVIQTKAVVITANKVKSWPTCLVIVLIIHKKYFHPHLLQGRSLSSNMSSKCTYVPYSFSRFSAACGMAHKSIYLQIDRFHADFFHGS